MTAAQTLKPWQQLKDITEQMSQVKRRVSIAESHKTMLNDQEMFVSTSVSTVMSRFNISILILAHVYI